MNNLQALLVSANFAMAFREKLDKLWDIDEVMDMLWQRARTPIISSHIAMLREEVGTTAPMICTVWRAGLIDIALSSLANNSTSSSTGIPSARTTSMPTSVSMRICLTLVSGQSRISLSCVWPRWSVMCAIYGMRFFCCLRMSFLGRGRVGDIPGRSSERPWIGLMRCWSSVRGRDVL